MLLTILSGRHGSDLRCNLIFTLNPGESCIPGSSLLFYRREEGPWGEFESGHDVEYQDTASSKVLGEFQKNVLIDQSQGRKCTRCERS